MTCVCLCNRLREGSHQDGLVLKHGPICHRSGLDSGIGPGPRLLSHLKGWACWVGYLAFQVMGLSGGVEGKENLG